MLMLSLYDKIYIWVKLVYNDECLKYAVVVIKDVCTYKGPFLSQNEWYLC